MSNIISLFKQTKKDTQPNIVKDDFGDRVAKIKASMEKINELMIELKRMAEKKTQ